MRICYLPIFFALASFQVLQTQAQYVRVIRQIDTDMSTLMSSIVSMMIPSEVVSLFTDSFQQIFSSAPVDFSALGSLTALGRKRRSAFSLEQLKRIRNEVDTLKRMMDTGDSHSSAEVPRVKRGSGDSSGDSSDMQGRAMEVGMKGSGMASNGTQGAQQDAKMSSNGAQDAKNGTDSQEDGAEMEGEKDGASATGVKPRFMGR